jgi:putative transposase
MGRFKAFPIEQDEHLLTVLRYVERNPLRAGLVEHAEDWIWSSLAWRGTSKRPAMLAPWPVACPRNWVRHVNASQTVAGFQALQ